MIELLYEKKHMQPIVLALGFFDCIHKGHRKILEEAKLKAKQKNCISAVTTFTNNPNSCLNGTVMLIHTYEERLVILEKLGIDAVLITKFSEEFKNISATNFLLQLCTNFNIKHIVCGYDYRFGKNAEGDIDFLKAFCDNKGIEISVISKTVFNGKRISSTLIREYLCQGNITEANRLLDYPYFIKGRVIHGKNIGTKEIYPTINLEYDKEKLKIKEGVYHTLTQIEDKKFISITNCGNKPTFEGNIYNFETYILDYNGNLYEKTVYIYFLNRLREEIKFSNAKELKNQISKDILSVRQATGKEFKGI